ncbi:Myb-like DNA-binding domain containing protein [Histomonas meleagridis]|uniref:Myb-like DNA-binding domain containing protein n=1 Tax=Histomonas meleagridis TaxID=135588 RepID=UPI003559D131|nr:Myb-like DNA-binding domain containing protein [Histomonas meleagridis]KAH0800622.1 Myb-like DNA-binding domain containing protein [Histomonas meleagridis]
MLRGASILVDVAMGFIIDTQLKFTDEELSTFREIFYQLITKKISREQARSRLLSICKVEDPYTRICAILDTEFQPIPPAPNDVVDNYVTRKKTRTWNINEDNRLYMGVCLFGPENWNEITPFVGNGRLRSQCSQRWLRVLDPKISKSAWSYEEDSMLIYLVNLFGEKSWMRVSNQIGTRSDVQCRYRYQQLQKEIKEAKGNGEVQKEKKISNEKDLQNPPTNQTSNMQELQIPLNEPIPNITNSFGLFQSNSLFDSTIWLN